MKIPVALSIAGSDPSGGAGIQADLKSFHQFGVYGEAVITLLTVQNTVAVEQVRVLEPDFVVAQLRAVLEDIPPLAAKTGALGNAALVEAIAFEATEFLFPLVVDPVMVSKHGAPLMDEAAREKLIELLLPAASLVTPNLPEASVITGRDIADFAQMRDAALAILDLGAGAVLLKGGHLAGDAIDLLLWPGGERVLPAPRLTTPHTHGTGCSYSAAITALLAAGVPLEEAVAQAKDWIHRAIDTNPGLGRGNGPVNHFAKPGPSRS
ncbi:bifunctional hydroxymethylpyrimidine kinase/phosphomethylpyrimidine kinase [Bryobacter aggregatus]|uniref:bifunctional hydroxymethylpyrimidine kinase/phosphomethylpyrimidine kinase n=1 Tax=Bryobacter aggregatus TaxID=360054 RepID=UPI000B1C57BA|nr:bifunctional hydroxymethylpyrimidine kinase/phosphomethylpyrimidine kinase [Bryobacter aggregatus]